MSINVYSPDGKFEAGSYMDGIWSGPPGTNLRGGLFNQPSNPSNPQNYQGFNQTLGQPNAPQVGQGLMGLGQQPQGNMPPQSSGFNPFDKQGAMPNYMSENRMYPNPAMQAPQAMQSMQQYGQTPFAYNEVPSSEFPTNSDWRSNPEEARLGGDMGVTIYKQPDGTYRDESGRTTDYSQYNQRINWTQNRGNPTQQPQTNQFFQPQPMQGQPVNTQTVQPNLIKE